MDAITRKYNRMVVEEKLRKRAEKRQEAKQEAASAELMRIINDNAYLANRFAKKLQEEKELRAKRAAKRNKIIALKHKGNLWLSGMFGTVAAAAVATIGFVYGKLPTSFVMTSFVIAAVAMVCGIGALYQISSKIAELMND